MLTNITEQAIVVRYNGIEIEVNAGENLDVRNFDISAGQTTALPKLIPLTEKHILKKHPGKFTQSETTDGSKPSTEYSEKLKNLTTENSRLSKENESLKRTNESNSKKIAELSEQVNGYGDKDTTYKSKIKELDKKLVEQEKEHEAHINRIMGKPTKSK